MPISRAAEIGAGSALQAGATQIESSYRLSADATPVGHLVPWEWLAFLLAF